MRYSVIMLDPPWPYRVWSGKTGAGGFNKTAALHYDAMTWPDLFALGPAVHAVAAPGAAIIIWCVPPSYDQAFAMAAAWGLTYKTKLFCWVKRSRASWGDAGLHVGLGHYTRANTEDAFLFTFGGDNPKRKAKDVQQVGVTESTLPESWLAPVGRHSAKPSLFHDRVTALFAGPYIEVFARRDPGRPGWAAVGNELDGLDVRESLGLLAADRPLPVLSYGGLL